MGYEERKIQEKKIRKVKNRIRSLEHEIGQLEAELERMDQLLMNPEHISGMQVYEEYETLRQKHDEALVSWEKQNIALEKLTGKIK